MMCEIVSKHWNDLQINLRSLKETKKIQKSKGHTTKNGKLFKTYLENRRGKSEPCITNKPSRCWK